MLDPSELSSYRPISNLSFISKTIERVVAVRFSEHAEAQHLLPRRQSAYRAVHSTETAVTAVHDDLVRNIDSGRISVLMLLDLSAAFDTVDHDILRRVLSKRFGVDGLAMDWFSSYLSTVRRCSTRACNSLDHPKLTVLYRKNSSPSSLRG